MNPETKSEVCNVFSRQQGIFNQRMAVSGSGIRTQSVSLMKVHIESQGTKSRLSPLPRTLFPFSSWNWRRGSPLGFGLDIYLFQENFLVLKAGLGLSFNYCLSVSTLDYQLHWNRPLVCLISHSPFSSSCLAPSGYLVHLYWINKWKNVWILWINKLGDKGIKGIMMVGIKHMGNVKNTVQRVRDVWVVEKETWI